MTTNVEHEMAFIRCSRRPRARSRFQHEDALDLTEITAEAFHWRGEARYPGKQAWALEGEFLAKRGGL